MTVGSAVCSVTASAADSITCDLAAVPGGQYSLTVATPELGLSDSDSTYTSDLTASSLAPASGSFGGGSLITITGRERPDFFQ